MARRLGAPVNDSGALRRIKNEVVVGERPINALSVNEVEILDVPPADGGKRAQSKLFRVEDSRCNLLEVGRVNVRRDLSLVRSILDERQDELQSHLLLENTEAATLTNPSRPGRSPNPRALTLLRTLKPEEENTALALALLQNIQA